MLLILLYFCLPSVDECLNIGLALSITYGVAVVFVHAFEHGLQVYGQVRPLLPIGGAGTAGINQAVAVRAQNLD